MPAHPNPIYDTPEFAALWVSSEPLRVLADWAGFSIAAVNEAGLKRYGPRPRTEGRLNRRVA